MFLQANQTAEDGATADVTSQVVLGANDADGPPLPGWHSGL